MQELDADTILKLSSTYISYDLKQERWAIKSVAIKESKLISEIKMEKFFISPTDPKGFHLSFLTAHEMIAQGVIILLHKMEGLKHKCREIWVSEVTSKFIRPIRNPHSIRLEISAVKIRRKSNVLICDVEMQLSDNSNGLFRSDGRAWLV